MKRIDRRAIEALPLDQQDEARALLEELERQYAANPLLRYEPHLKQQQFHASHAQLKAFMGGNRAGKTTAGILDDLIQCVDRDVVPPSLLPYKKFEPPFHGRIIVPGEDLLNAVVLQKIREWCPSSQFVGGRFDKAYEKSHAILRFANGSFLDFLTYGMDLDKFGGTAKHRIHYDECPPFDIWQEGKMRLLDYKGADELFTLTPLLGLEWMYEWIWEPWEKGELEDGFVVVVDIDDNPYLDKEQKKKLLKGYSKEELQARKEGRFVHFHGMIYPEFSRMGDDGNVMPAFRELPPNVTVLVGIDPGIRHMAAVVWCFIDELDRLIVFDELALTGKTVAEVAEAIKMRNMRWGETVGGDQGVARLLPLKPRHYFIDPASRNINDQTGRNTQREFQDHGIYTALGQNSVVAGINRVKERLQSNRLIVCANCTVLIDEFRKYRWNTPTRREGEAKETPIKQDDHLLDALRYVVASRPVVPGRQITQRRMSPAEKAAHDEITGVRWRRKKNKAVNIGGIPYYGG